MAWMEEPAERLKLLRAMFDDAGLNYQVDQNARGWFYVRLGYETRGGSPVVVTAIVQELVVRVTAHAVLGGLSETERNRLNRDWGFGRFCLGEGGVDATASLYLGGRRPNGELIRFVVEHLVDSGEIAASGQVPLFDVAGGLGCRPRGSRTTSTRLRSSLRRAMMSTSSRRGFHRMQGPT